MDRARLELWATSTALKEREIELPGGYGGAWAVTPHGDALLWADRSGGLRWLALGGGERRRFRIPEAARAYLEAETAGIGRFGGIDHPDGSYEDRSVFHPPYGTACDIATAPDGQAFVAAYGQSHALVWDLRTGGLRQLLGGDVATPTPSRIYRVAWSPDGRAILTAESSGQLRLWDAASGLELVRVPLREDPHADAVDRPSDMPAEVGSYGGLGAVAFTPDSRYVVACDGVVVRRWERESGREIASWAGHGAEHPILGRYPGTPVIRDIRFAADGRRALTVGVDATLRVWDTATDRELWNVTPDVCCIDWGDISPDGHHVIWAGCPGMRLYVVG